jgi:secreted PhoX family phosphatase
VVFDSSNNQWVPVCGNSTGNNGSLVEYAASAVANLPNNSSPSANVVLSDNGTGALVNCPWTATFDKSGDLWVANSDEYQITTPPQGFVTEYQPNQFSTGSPVPYITLADSDFVSPTGVLFDPSGNLFVFDYGPQQFGESGSGAVYVFKAATVASFTQGTNTTTPDAQLLDSSTATPVNGAFDSSGNLWVADCSSGTNGDIYMFPKSSLTSGAGNATTVIAPTSITLPNGMTESSLNCPGGIAFDAQGNLWYTNFYSNTSKAGAVGEFLQSQISVSGSPITPTPNIFLEGAAAGPNAQPIGLTFGPGL